jgi:penicillin-binding protein 2
MTNMCIGQGFLLVTPLQMANGYAGIARNKMLVPHYFHSVLNEKGEAVVKAKAIESPLQPEIEEGQIARVKDGLERVIWRMGGSFNELPVWVAGKSGTAEMFSAKADYSWFVAYAPVEKPKYCVACLVEQAGDGSSAAVLGVQHTLAAIYGVDIGDIVVEHGSYER